MFEGISIPLGPRAACTDYLKVRSDQWARNWRRLCLLRRGRAPRQLIIQLTDRCNAHCPQCGMRAGNGFARTSLSLADGRRLIDHAAHQGVEFLSFTGGEPLLLIDDLLALIRHAQERGIPYIRTGTNGFQLAHPQRQDFHDRVTRLAKGLAASGLYNFWISLDSADPALHEEMRGISGLVDGIAEALPIFHRHGIYPSANLGINRNTGGFALPGPEADDRTLLEAYRDAFSRFYETVIALGFTIVNACYPMSAETSTNQTDAVYQAISDDALVRFSPREKSLLFQALADTTPRYRSRIRIFSPRSSLLSLSRQHAGQNSASYPCAGGRDYFFVDSNNCNTYPCGYRAKENLGKFWDLQLDQHPAGDHCTACDWECFRDPSELLGPVTDLLRRPSALLRRLVFDRGMLGVWLDDLRYYRACDYFNGRKPPQSAKLQAFA